MAKIEVFAAAIMGGLIGGLAGSTVAKPKPEPVHIVEMPIGEQPAAKVAAPKDDEVQIRFVTARGWKVNHGPWGDGEFGEPGFHAVVSPPMTGYGEVRCEALDAKGTLIGASWDNWSEAHGPVAIIPHFDLLGKPSRIVCRLIEA